MLTRAPSWHGVYITEHRGKRTQTPLNQLGARMCFYFSGNFCSVLPAQSGHRVPDSRSSCSSCFWDCSAERLSRTLGPVAWKDLNSFNLWELPCYKQTEQKQKGQVVWNGDVVSKSSPVATAMNHMPPFSFLSMNRNYYIMKDVLWKQTSVYISTNTNCAVR